MHFLFDYYTYRFEVASSKYATPIIHFAFWIDTLYTACTCIPYFIENDTHTHSQVREQNITISNSKIKKKILNIHIFHVQTCMKSIKGIFNMYPTMYIRRIAQAFADREQKNRLKFRKNLNTHDTWKLEFRAAYKVTFWWFAHVYFIQKYSQFDHSSRLSFFRTHTHIQIAFSKICQKQRAERAVSLSSEPEIALKACGNPFS